MLKKKIHYKRIYKIIGVAITAVAITACDGSDSPANIVTDETDNTGGNSDGETNSTVSTVNPTNFIAGALSSSEIVDCQLSDGTAAQCYELVTAGTEKTTDMIAPFCPSSTSSTSDEGGVWLDGDAIYEANGEFFLNLPNLYGQTYPPVDNWILYDENGNLRITDTLEACQAAARPDVDPEYQSYCVECSLDDLDTADLPLTFLIPVTPARADSIGTLTGTAGISLNGFQIAAQAPVEDILSNWTLAAFDDCGGHVNPNDGYHYHSATGADGCNSGGTEADGHSALIGYAMDGYGIYGTLSVDDAEANSLDQCNGAEDATRGYHYHAASPESNQHIACFYGKTTETANDNRPPPP